MVPSGDLFRLANNRVVPRYREQFSFCYCCGSIRLTRYPFRRGHCDVEVTEDNPSIRYQSCDFVTGVVREAARMARMDWVIHRLKLGTYLINKAILDWNEHQTCKLC